MVRVVADGRDRDGGRGGDGAGTVMRVHIPSLSGRKRGRRVLAPGFVWELHEEGRVAYGLRADELLPRVAAKMPVHTIARVEGKGAASVAGSSRGSAPELRRATSVDGRRPYDGAGTRMLKHIPRLWTKAKGTASAGLGLCLWSESERPCQSRNRGRASSGAFTFERRDSPKAR